MGRWSYLLHERRPGEWSRKQKRGYQRVRSLLWFWESHQFQVLWVTLSTAEGGMRTSSPTITSNSGSESSDNWDIRA